MERWRGKVAVVTGASAGIGLAIVQELIKHGVITVALSRRPQLVEDIKKELSSEQAAILHSLPCDVTEETAVIEAFQWIREKLQFVHILINNAGVFTKGTLMNGPVENWRKTLDVNIMGLCLTTKEALDIMSETGVTDGHIIHINSVAGHKVPNVSHIGSIDLNVYPATKHAVTALAETLRMEVSSKKLKTKITSLSPGLVRTDIFKANDVDSDGNFFQGNCLEPSQVADATMFVLSTDPNVNISELTIQPVGEVV